MLHACAAVLLPHNWLCVRVQAVLAVLQHKLTEAANTSASRANASAAAAVKQQLCIAQKEAEAKANKQLQEAAEQVGGQHATTAVSTWWLRRMLVQHCACLFAPSVGSCWLEDNKDGADNGGLHHAVAGRQLLQLLHTARRSLPCKHS